MNDDQLVANSRYFKGVIPCADILYDQLESSITWTRKRWGNGYLPRLCCHSVQEYKVGANIVKWLREFFENCLGVQIRVKDVFGNYYRDGKDYLPDHQDQYGEDWVISCSFGAKRLFRFRNLQTKKIIQPKFYLSAGDIILFNPLVNSKYKHGIPKQPQIKEGRINLTVFATITDPQGILTNDFNKEVIPYLDVLQSY